METRTSSLLRPVGLDCMRSGCHLALLLESGERAGVQNQEPVGWTLGQVRYLMLHVHFVRCDDPRRAHDGIPPHSLFLSSRPLRNFCETKQVGCGYASGRRGSRGASKPQGMKFFVLLSTEGRGLTPWDQWQDLCMAGLASCCSMTLQTTAKARELTWLSGETCLCLPLSSDVILCRIVERTGKMEKGSLVEVHVIAQDQTKGTLACLALAAWHGTIRACPFIASVMS